VASQKDINNQKELNKEMGNTKSAARGVNEEIGSLYDQLRGVTSELKGQANEITKSRSAFRSFEKAAQDLKLQQEGINRLTDDQVTKLNKTLSKQQAIAKQEAERLLSNTAISSKISEIQQEIQEGNLSLEDGNDYLLSEISLLQGISTEEKAILSARYDSENVIKKIVDQAKEEEETRKDINKAMGVSGGILKGLNEIGGSFAKAFKLDEVVDDMEEFADETIRAEGSVSRLSVSVLGMKSAFTNAFKTLTDPAVVIGSLVKGFNAVDKAQTQFQRETGATVSHFDTLNSELLLSSEYIGAATELSKELGMNAANVFSAEDITEVALMTKQIGLAGKEVNALAMQSKINGMSVEDNNNAIFDGVNAMNKQNGSAINGKKVLQDVANVSEDIAVNYAGYPGELAAAATAAAGLGMNLSQVDKIAGSLLDFESSIQAEMEAELLTGKSLNLEKARQLALDNDLAGVANELANQGITMASFGSMTRVAQEAQAKALGMSKQEMAKMLMMKEMEGNLDRESLTAAQQQTYDSIKRQEAQDKFNTAIGKMQEALAPVVGFFADILSSAYVMKPLMVAIGAVMAVKMAKSALSFASSMKGAVTSSFSLLKNLSGSGSLMGKMYKGGQFMPGGGRAAAGGQRAGGLMGKIKGAFSAPEGLDKGAASVAGAADKTKGIDPAQGSGIKEFLTGLGDGLASIGEQFGKVVAGGVALGLALFAMGGGMALAMPLIAGSDPVLMLAFAASISAIGLTVAVMGKMGGDIIKGALALGIMAIALIPAAYAFSLLAGVDASSILAFSIAIPILGLSVLALGLIFTNPVTMFLFGAGILGLVSLGLAILPLAAAFSILKDVDIPTIGAGLMSLANKDLIEGLSSFGIAISSLATPLLISSIAFAILGPSLQSTAIGFEMLAASNMIGTVDSLQILSTLSPGLMNTSKALLALAGSLTAVGIAGLIATPAMAVMSLFGVMGGEESSGKSSSGESSSGESSKEDGGMAKINANLEKLIAVISAGGDVYIDGAKVGKTVALATSKMG
jgi:hypothetical protein